jgi:Zinc knuckle
MWDDHKYNQIKLIVSELENCDSNFRKSVNKEFKTDFLRGKRQRVIQIKIIGLRLTKELLAKICNLRDKLRTEDKREKIHDYTKRILTVIRRRLGRTKTPPVDIEFFPYFLDFLQRRGMANFSYGDAKHLPELKEVSKDSTKIRDFLATIRAYHEELSPEGRVRLITFVKNAKILGIAKTKFGPGADVLTLAQLEETLYARCGTKETFESLKEQLEGLKMKETLEGMVEEINELSNRLAAIEVQRLGAASATVVNEIVQRDALRLFKKKVPEQLKAVIEAARPGTIEEALTVASAAMAGAQAEDHSLLWGETSGRKENSWRNKRTEAKKKGNFRCFRCNNTGHFAKDCFAKIELKSRDMREDTKRDKRFNRKKRAYVAESDELSTSSTSGSSSEEEERALERPKPSKKAAEGRKKDF